MKIDFISETICSERGATMLEFAVSTIFFFALLLGIMQFSVAGYQLLATQFAVNTALRQGVVLDGSVNRLKAFQDNIVKVGSAYGLTLDVSKMNFCDPSANKVHVKKLNEDVNCCTDPRPDAFASDECKAANTAGNAGSLVQVTVNQDVPLFTARSPITIRRTFLAKNEYYPS